MAILKTKRNTMDSRAGLGQCSQLSRVTANRNSENVCLPKRKFGIPEFEVVLSTRRQTRLCLRVVRAALEIPRIVAPCPAVFEGFSIDAHPSVQARLDWPGQGETRDVPG